MSFNKKTKEIVGMEIRKLLEQKRFTLSFEVFPPVREGNLENLYKTVEGLGELSPDFISVTYGAGGSTRDKSLEIASKVKNSFQREVLAHLTCVQATRDDIARILDAFREAGIENIMALRGDPPAGTESFVPTAGGFRYANDLVAFIRERRDFCVGVAGYPEGHIEAPSLDADLKNLKRKVDAGADFIITQLFFNNESFYRFRDRADQLKIQVPIIPGIFPILNYKQIKRIVSLCGAHIPAKLGEKIDRVKDKPEETEKYGIEYAVVQIEDLLRNDLPGLHIYSMNRSEPVRCILRELKLSRTASEPDAGCL
jgi:methylenetetrahydrofolate reductase (NADPH)